MLAFIPLCKSIDIISLIKIKNSPLVEAKYVLNTVTQYIVVSTPVGTTNFWNNVTVAATDELCSISGTFR